VLEASKDKVGGHGVIKRTVNSVHKQYRFDVFSWRFIYASQGMLIE